MEQCFICKHLEKWVINHSWQTLTKYAKLKLFFFIKFLFNCSVVSDSLQSHRLQHSRLSCPSVSPKVFSNSCPVSQWYHPTISFFVAPFSSYLQSFPASVGCLPMSQSVQWVGSLYQVQVIGASASTSVFIMNIQGCFPLGLTGLISLLSKGLSTVFSSITAWNHQFFGAQPSLWSDSHICMWLLEKT